MNGHKDRTLSPVPPQVPPRNWAPPLPPRNKYIMLCYFFMELYFVCFFFKDGYEVSKEAAYF